MQAIWRKKLKFQYKRSIHKRVNIPCDPTVINIRRKCVYIIQIMILVWILISCIILNIKQSLGKAEY